MTRPRQPGTGGEENRAFPRVAFAGESLRRRWAVPVRKAADARRAETITVRRTLVAAPGRVGSTGAIIQHIVTVSARASPSHGVVG